MYRGLQDYIALLEKEGELIRIKKEVDPVYEIAEITDRVSKMEGGGKALLFENSGSGIPVLTNMMGSDRRMALALSAQSLDEIPEGIDALAERVLSPMDRVRDKLRMLPLAGRASRWLPKKSKRSAPCQEIVQRGDEVDLGQLPILKCWAYDGGRFVTLPLVHTEDPVTGARNVGMYRMQVVDKQTTGMHWHVHKTGERHYEEYRRLGKRMPVSVAIGGDPVYTYAATAPLPDGIDEYILAGYLRNRGVRLVKCITNDLYVPADCDIIIEGYVDPTEDKFMEGPFGDHTGYYSLEDIYPYFHVTAITRRKDAIYPATLVGVPPQEDAYIAKATERIFLSPIRLVVQPEIEDLYMPSAGIAHNLALLSIEKKYSGQALKTASSMWGAGQMMFNKMMIITSSGVNLHDSSEIAKLLRHANLEEDVLISAGVLDILDHATATPGKGGKMAFDLTDVGEKMQNTFPKDYKLPQWVDSVEDGLAEEWGVVILYASVVGEIDISEFVEMNGLSATSYVVVMDKRAKALTPYEKLWFGLGNIEIGRDVEIESGVMMVDARSKTPPQSGYPLRWPNVVTSLEETIELVDRRWEEYGLGEFVESPSKRYRQLIFSDKAQV